MTRQEALERFRALPWPVRTDEEWRRTDPALLGLPLTEISSEGEEIRARWETLDPRWIQAGVILTDLKTAFKQFPELLEEFLFKTGNPEALAKFTALHEASWKQGLFCYVPEGTLLEGPLRASLEITGGSGQTVFPHTLIVVEKGAQVTLVDERRSEGVRNPLFSNERVEIFVKEGARLQYLHLQRWSEPVAELFTQRALLGKDSEFLNVTMGLGGRISKASVETVLAESGARAELLGVFFGRGKQHFDFHTMQDHQAPQTTSDLLYKSALKDEAKLVYTGLIRIRKAAQKSDAYQANRNLLLDQGAKADSIPMLEIEADDVRCTHGVAVGPVEEEQLFYLESRGLSRGEAERLIVAGFFEQVFKRIPLEELKEELLQEVDARLLEKEEFKR
ncbi:MAG: Fe-S cluster assembly protein SufD [Candidatus Omnitrophica bacterium]|nr:Fe-S cluster assembly protein SufD [Candidatus Omnitrophota bacterium]